MSGGRAPPCERRLACWCSTPHCSCASKPQAAPTTSAAPFTGRNRSNQTHAGLNKRRALSGTELLISNRVPHASVCASAVPSRPHHPAHQGPPASVTGGALPAAPAAAPPSVAAPPAPPCAAALCARTACTASSTRKPFPVPEPASKLQQGGGADASRRGAFDDVPSATSAAGAINGSSHARSQPCRCTAAPSQRPASLCSSPARQAHRPITSQEPPTVHR